MFCFVIALLIRLDEELTRVKPCFMISSAVKITLGIGAPSTVLSLSQSAIVEEFDVVEEFDL
jgi:hypothetical protein